MKDRGQAGHPDRAIHFGRSARGWLRGGWWSETDEVLPEERLQRQTRRVLGFCLAMSVWVPVFGGIYHVLRQPRAVAILTVAGVLLAGIAALVSATRRPQLCGNLLVALALGVYTSLAVVTGGATSPVGQWYVSVPVLAFLLVGLRWGILWTAVTLTLISGLFAANRLGWEFKTDFTPNELEFLEWSGLSGIVSCVAALSIVFKIMERKHEAALKEAFVQAKAADRAKSEFLANMSHEIRTPLTAILGYTELLSATGESPAEDDCVNAEEVLSTIHRNGQHLLQIINDILDLSKIEAGMLVVDRAWISPRQLVNDVASLMQVRAAAKHLCLETSFSNDFPDEIETDPTRLRQVLLNIVGNGIKFTEKGSVSIRASAESGAIEFVVSDSGIGMNANEVQRLFRPFSQADTSTARRFGGTGLGLAISQRLVEVMGGQIDVDSEPGVGSRFAVRLDNVRSRCRRDPDAHSADVVQQSATDSTAIPASSVPLAGCRILLAEDGPDNQRLIKHVLCRAGADVSVADNGKAAKEAALTAWQAGAPFDIVLMDVQMPVLGGHEATAQLRALGYDRPILALTAHALTTDHEKCLAAGCDDVCTKPIDRAALFDRIRRHWQQARGCLGKSV
ncbi:MAG TPA: ATP-binding protein [Pirellulales bacterium]|nr:ATP-binding protein [Pirellulales bacterium]